MRWVLIFLLSILSLDAHLKIESTLYQRAQEIIWINEEEAAVGRWDGTLSLIHADNTLSLIRTCTTPSKKAITALAKIDSTHFVSSNDEESFVIWENLQDSKVQPFPKELGEVDSAFFLSPFLCTGHSKGVLLIWKWSEGDLKLLHQINLSQNNPLKNIRSITAWKGLILTASEEGLLTLLNPCKGKILWQQHYSPSATRGINSIACYDNHLLVANCQGEPHEANLWLFEINEEGLMLLDSLTLIQDPTRSRAYLFHVAADSQGQFFCSSEEGVLWMGKIEKDKLQLLEVIKLGNEGATAFALHDLKPILITADHDVHLVHKDKHPER